MKYAVIVDLETTGLDPEKDEITEIGLLEFCHENYTAPSITKIYGALQQPSTALTEPIKKLTGLSDEMLRGEAIDWEQVSLIMGRAELIIAHNASFDHSFLIRAAGYKPSAGRWACSKSHIDWSSHGFKSQSLNYIACDQGFINPFAHRAVFDCATTFRIITPYLAELAETSLQQEFEVAAVGSPFESKDTLRIRGYQWDGVKRVWARRVFESRLSDERAFLESQVYAGKPSYTVSPVQMF